MLRTGASYALENVIESNDVSPIFVRHILLAMDNMISIMRSYMVLVV